MTETTIQAIIADAQPAPQGTLELLRGDMIAFQPIEWLWAGWLARGKLHILAGAPGTGKTTIALALAACVTQGGLWPDGSSATKGDVVIWSGEDDPQDTLAPRLKAAGADMTRVHIVSGITDTQGRRPFDPAHDMAELALRMATLKPALMLVDPIVSAVAGDSHKNTETRRALQPLVDMAAQYGVAVLGITHFSKGSAGRNPTERVTGSLAFAAMARVVMVAAKMADEAGGGRIFCRAKSNIGRDDGGFHYELSQVPLSGHDGMYASRVSWGAAVEGSASQLLADAEAQQGDGESLTGAREFLLTELAGAPVSAKAIKHAAEQAGHSWRTIERAKTALGIESRKDGLNGGWKWFLPPNTTNFSEERQQNTVADFDGLGGLQPKETVLEVPL